MQFIRKKYLYEVNVDGYQTAEILPCSGRRRTDYRGCQQTAYLPASFEPADKTA
jgi:hypothetical protein